MTTPYNLTIPLMRDIQGQVPQAICALTPTNVSRNLIVNRDKPPFNDPEIRRALALTHAAGAPAYGSPPDGWRGDGWLGPLSELLPLSLDPVPTWSEFYAHQRIEAILAQGRRLGIYDDQASALFEKVAARVASGELDTGEPPSRLHGDLWAGNVVWTARGGVLIDPAAHGGHREADLAFLVLFGAPHLDAILGGYGCTSCTR